VTEGLHQHQPHEPLHEAREALARPGAGAHADRRLPPRGRWFAARTLGALSLAAGAALSLAASSTVRAAAPPALDRVAVIFDAPETGGPEAPRAILERELSFEARLEALAVGEPVGDERGPYGSRHVRAALDRHIATELLAALPDEARAEPPDPCEARRPSDPGTTAAVSARTDEGDVALARSLLLARLRPPKDTNAEAALEAAMSAEHITEDDLVRLLRREARAARYLDRVVAPMLAPTDGELRALLRTPDYPLSDKPFAEVRCVLRSALLSQRLGKALGAFLQTSRLRLHVRNALP
jgi:hypothetical protein